MGTETIDHKVEEAHKPGLRDTFDSEVKSGIEYSVDIANFLEVKKIPTAEDGKKPDVYKLIHELIDGVAPFVDKYFKDRKDPNWTPDFESLQNALKPYENLIGPDGKIRREVREALINAFSPQNYILGRQQGRLSRAAVGDGKKFGTDLANETSNKALIKMIEGSTTPGDVSRASAPVMSELYQKRQQGYGLHGSFDYLKAKPNPLELPNVSEHVGAQAKAYAQKHQS